MTKSLHSDRYAEALALMRRARLDAGLTQAQVAVRLGKPQSYVSKLERGERRADVVEFTDFVEATGMDALVAFRALKSAIGPATLPVRD